jgi:Recombination endonuclease VII
MRPDAIGPYCWTQCRVLAQRESNLRNNYGISVVEFNRMEQDQDGVCRACGRPPSGKGRNGKVLHVHHSHVTKEVIALLCRDCNVYWDKRSLQADQIAGRVRLLFP